MNENLDPEGKNLNPADREIEKALRPGVFVDFAGQEAIVENLKVFVQAARGRDEALDHVLLHGPPGLGKTTLAHIIANELNVNIRVTSGPVLDKPGDLAGLLTGLEANDVLFIDEIHRLSPVVEEYLYSAMEDFKIDIMLETGPNARSIQIKLNPFTLVGATTRSGLLTAPLRSRFGINSRLNYYQASTLDHIIRRSAEILGVPIDREATAEIARTQVWQWIRHLATLDDGKPLTALRFRRVLDEEMETLRGEVGPERFASGRFAPARDLFLRISTAETFVEFLTLPAYDAILKAGM